MKRKFFCSTLVVFIYSLVFLTIVCCIGIPVQAEQLMLEVTDFEDTVFQLQNARIFIPTPTSCDSCPPKIVTLDGIEVMDDSEKYIVPWEIIEQIEKEYADNDNIIIFLIDGETLNVKLSVDPEQILSGDTDSGGYRTMRIQDVKNLKVIRGEDQ